jgi:2-hydroxy-6-oxonona-2,4-dienedioate hydrolase
MDEHAYRQAERDFLSYLGVTPKEQRIRLERNAVTVRVQEHGDGPPVLFLHGGPGSCGTAWATLAARLPDLRCLLVDRPGTGLSDRKSLSGPAAVRHEAETLVVDVLDALGLDRAHLVGSSHGGYAALLAGAEYPDRVDRTVLVGSPGLVQGAKVTLFDRLLLAPGGRHVFGLFPASERALRSTFRQLGHGPDLELPRAEMDWYVALQRHTDTMRNDFETIANMGTFRGGFDASLWIGPELLGRVRSPTYLLWGAQEVYGDAAVATRAADALPDAELELIEGGHLIWLDAPDVVRKHVLGLARVS